MSDELRPFGGQHLETMTARIVRMKGVGEALQSYVDALMPYAAKGKRSPPPNNPAIAHQYTMIADRLVIRLMPNKKYTTVRFWLTTEDDIPLKITEDMEWASSDRLQFMKKEIDDYLRDERAKHRQIVIH